MKKPKWFEEQEKIPHWMSIALLQHTAPHGRWTEDKQTIGEGLTASIKQYSESYGWSEEVKNKLFKPKHPESNGTYMEPKP